MACLFTGLYNALFGPTYYPMAYIEQTAHPGDLIAFDRGTYQHYALYIGSSKVINIGAEDIESTSALISEMTLKEVAGPSYGRIENHREQAKMMFGVRSTHRLEIVRRAKKHVGQYLPYEFLFRNCEYYCTLWRFGVGFSTQVIQAKPLTGINRYEKFAEHRATCKCSHDHICHCPVEILNAELLDLLVP